MAGAGALILLAVSLVVYGVCVVVGVACVLWKKAFSHNADGDDHLNIWRRRRGAVRRRRGSIVMDDSGDPITTVSGSLSYCEVPAPPSYDHVMLDIAAYDQQFPPPSYSELQLNTVINVDKET